MLSSFFHHNLKVLEMVKMQILTEDFSCIFLRKYSRKNFLKNVLREPNFKNVTLQKLQIIWRCFCDYSTRGLYHETHYSRNLRISVISQSVCPWQAFPAQSNVSEQGWSLHFSCSTIGKGPRVYHQHQIILENPARNKHSNLLCKSINQGHNKFYVTGPRTPLKQIICYLGCSSCPSNL